MAEKLTAKMAVERWIIYSEHDSAVETFDGYVYSKKMMIVLSEVLDRIKFNESVEGKNENNINFNL